MSTVTQQIREHMNDKGVSLSDIAEERGVSRQNISQMLTPERETVTQEVIEILESLGLRLTVVPIHGEEVTP